jgi:hypothetical protein
MKKHPNHHLYIQTLRQMTPEARLRKAFELSDFSKSLFITGLRVRFPNFTKQELHQIFLERLAKCHNRNY